jgi:hypothetical protein
MTCQSQAHETDLDTARELWLHIKGSQISAAVIFVTDLKQQQKGLG